MDYANTLTIRFRGKGVPYGPAERDNGDRNHGFSNLKGEPTLVAGIPELQDDPDLMQLVVQINAAHTGLFTVGCVSGETSEDQQYWRGGYIELAWNSVAHSSGAERYFPLFFHFGRWLDEQKFPHPVGFRWQLEPAHFFETNSDGFTCTIFVNTAGFDTAERARECWRAALTVLTTYLGSIPIQGDDPIYIPGQLSRIVEDW